MLRATAQSTAAVGPGVAAAAVEERRRLARAMVTVTVALMPVDPPDDVRRGLLLFNFVVQLGRGVRHGSDIHLPLVSVCYVVTHPHVQPSSLQYKV